MRDKENIIQILKQGGIGVLPTDTLYGLVGKALNQETVERIYKARRRNPQKPFIILISDLKDLKKFNIRINDEIRNKLKKIWPSSVSVILKCDNENLKYLHRGVGSLAFRLSDNKNLNDIIKETGPLVAPSANLEGEKPAQTINQARKYFSDKINFYDDAGKLEAPSSTLIKIDEKGIVEILREGADLEKIIRVSSQPKR